MNSYCYESCLCAGTSKDSNQTALNVDFTVSFS